MANTSYTPKPSGQYTGSEASSGAEQSTPATSPESSNEAFYGPRMKAEANTGLPRDALDFRQNLNNYLPLGCLTCRDYTTVDPTGEPADWQDIDSVAVSYRNDAGVYGVLSKLTEAAWIRLQSGRSAVDSAFITWRIYILPGDIGHRFIDRQNKRLWSALESLIPDVDVSRDAWEGRYTPETEQKFDPWATCDEGSLFYMFNTLPSPSPEKTLVEEKYAREALEDILDPTSQLPGLKTALYPYQKRSAGLMLQRESVSTLQLDPRLEPRTAPDGTTYYYSARDLLFLKQPRYYEACRGGILAETMGLGKTVILLAMILATKDHPPKVPTEHSTVGTRPKSGSLAEMAISAIHRKAVPWKVEFDRIRHATGDDMQSCIGKIQNSPPCYHIPMEPQRWNRKTILPPPKKMTLASTTLIVVPRNLCKQWQSELMKHVDASALKVLVMEDLRRALPPPSELRTYDVVLFTRNRFEMEIRDGSDEQGRRILATQLACRCPYIGATRTRDCNCLRSNDLYDSPLKHLHFKRLIIDEGHFFSNSGSTAVSVANKLVKADHRWVVSGTPAKDLLGVEVDISGAESSWQTPGTTSSRDAVLKQRKTFNLKEDTAGAVKSLGSLATHFLKIRPWCPSDAGERKAEWDDFIYRHQNCRKRTFSGFSTGLRRTLEAMVVKTQPEDVERDIELPPLSHEIIRLEPSFYDKLTANLFTLVLTANAVTSERTDADYLFHKNSAKARCHLIHNLRQSAFFWTGFSEADVEASIKNSSGYLNRDGTACSPEDRQLLTEMLACAEATKTTVGWASMSRSHELGLFMENWPSESAEHWAFSESRSPLLTGVSQLLEAQKYVNERAGTHDPGEGLAGAGIRSLAPARHGTSKEEAKDVKRVEKPLLTKSGIPTSSLDGEPALKRRSSASSRGAKSPQQKRITKTFKSTKPKSPKDQTVAKQKGDMSNTSSPSTVSASTDGARTNRKRRHSEIEFVQYPSDSQYLQSRIVGTTSAKLSYLVSQIVKHYQDEKILVFYDGDNIAYYIAQVLELLHIKHEIYAKSLAAHLKSEYVVRFDQEQQDRVLLMDVKQAAFGLNLSSASRIYFVNPVCRPNVEAQAIKRAHRIGQTREVHVETLVLKGSIEEKMLERSKRMTRVEHMDAKVLEDDGGMQEIIQSARLIPLTEDEKKGSAQMALLEEPQQLWGRPGWQETVQPLPSDTLPNEKKKKKPTFNDVTNPEDDMRMVDEDHEADPKLKRQVLTFTDRTNPDQDETLVDTDASDNEPLMSRRRRKLSSESAAVRSADTRLKNDANPILNQMAPTEQLAPIPSPLTSPRREFSQHDGRSWRRDVPLAPSESIRRPSRVDLSDDLNSSWNQGALFQPPVPLRDDGEKGELLRSIIQML
ncbi:hypothetical protein KC343_g8734 [Hortaea werneckii]|uniref:Helicase C-terminal domain-containing protein n=1 Tax=Hortaea werneckii TaxID=91943 RepID=A0A3M7DNS3_HORWE|nr:hypothetical protein KC317_g8580 [Hortaea werneckii]KAI7610610.1 hypothetical protein KC346_g8662 [Hortaea werneckii]KAI7619414.1 hypothetical protein KC343_g8734 [Hortaea werneckii]KAI7678976.1 hypothetical protein KC319_g3011 [Hortaea werneckii]KAI7700936.1 hypothetical protein KC322_g8107 [Hortaea werneckii]